MTIDILYKQGSKIVDGRVDVTLGFGGEIFFDVPGDKRDADTNRKMIRQQVMDKLQESGFDLYSQIWRSQYDRLD